MDTIGRSDTSRIGGIDHRSNLIWFIPWREGTTAWRIGHSRFSMKKRKKKWKERGRRGGVSAHHSHLSYLHTTERESIEHLTSRGLRNTYDQLIVQYFLCNGEQQVNSQGSNSVFTYENTSVTAWNALQGICRLYDIPRLILRQKNHPDKVQNVVLENFDCDFKDQH